MRRNLSALLLAMAASVAHAQEYGQWYVSRLDSENAVIAMSLNDSGSALFKMCDSESCFWFMASNTTCEADAMYPAMLNSSAGATSLQLTCRPNKKTPGRYVIGDPDTIDKAVTGGGTVGVAFPLQSGDFRVSRFKVEGWARAEQQLINLARKLPAAVKDRNL